MAMRAALVRGDGDEALHVVQGGVLLLAAAPAEPLEGPQGQVPRRHCVEERAAGAVHWGGTELENPSSSSLWGCIFGIFCRGSQYGIIGGQGRGHRRAL